MTVLGVIADTHGHLCDDARDALAGADAILHAGDVGGDPERDGPGEALLARLREIAPVVAVVGNGDPGLTHVYPWEQRVEVEGRRILLCHWYDNFGRIHPAVARELEAFRPDVLVHGHTHQAVNEPRDGCLHFNPGYSGPPGGGRRRSVGRLAITPASIEAEIVSLPS
jgi:putative phosphoesterase